MKKVAIVTDSSAYLPPEIVEELDIHVVPLTLKLGRGELPGWRGYQGRGILYPIGKIGHHPDHQPGDRR